MSGSALRAIGPVLHMLTDNRKVPGKRYALTLQLMLRRARKRKAGFSSHSPASMRDSRHPMPAMIATNHNGNLGPHLPSPHHRNSEGPFSPTGSFDAPYSANPHPSYQHLPVAPSPGHAHQPQQNRPGPLTDADQIWEGFSATIPEQLPVWISDQSLGGNTFSQHGMDAFLLPPDYLPPAPQIW